MDACIRPKRIGERQLAVEHCRHLMAHDLLLLDRGYPRLVVVRPDPFTKSQLLRPDLQSLESGSQLCRIREK